MDNLSKALVFLLTAIGFGIFLLIVILKLNVIQDKAEADMKRTIAEEDWQGYLYQQTVQSIIKNSTSKQ